MKARRAEIHISDDALKRAMHMPDSCKIISGFVSWEYGYPFLRLVVEDDGLPEAECAEGEPVPLFHPTITTTPQTYTWSWGEQAAP